jgi:extracellular elastinolytic metalloproteinase
MSREVDVRDSSVNRATSARMNKLTSMASDATTKDLNVSISRFSPVTGNPELMASVPAASEKVNFVQRALDHVQRLSRPMGLAATQSAEYMPDPNYQTTSSGAVAVHLRQKYKGIKIFQAAQTVRFDPDGGIKETVGNTFTVSMDLPVSPRLSVEDAVLAAAKFVASPHADEQGAKDQFGEPVYLSSIDLTDFVPKVTAAFNNGPDRSTVLENGPFGDNIKANLEWFPLGDGLKLAWQVILTMPKSEGQYRVIVNAETGEILYSHQLMKSLVFRGNVFKVDGGQPRQMSDIPLPMNVYGLPPKMPMPPSPPAFPWDWVESDSTAGNNVYAHLGDDGPTVKGSVKDGVLIFDNPDDKGDFQKVVNIFYYCNYMHDFLYVLGFREADGNFQKDSFNRGGQTGDRVDARSYPGAVEGTANMSTPADGKTPIMRMGLVTSTNRHTAMDSTVVFHEYTHGLTNRMVGGPMNDSALEADQSGGMGEGWSDYMACTINNMEVVGAWVVNNPDGIRQFRYDSNFPDNFGDIGRGRYDEVHNIGEIWCATLLEMNRRIGKELTLDLVLDSLRLAPANPSFIDMRDSMLAALEHMLTAPNPMSPADYDKAKKGMWAVFAKFGMGVGAKSNGPTLDGVVGSFEIPSTGEPGATIHVEANPNLAIPDNNLNGVTSVLNVAETASVARLAVTLKIQHNYIGDLNVRLTTPAGKIAILSDREGASTRNLDRTFTSQDTPALAALIGEQARGDWTLLVADVAENDTGTFDYWSLDFNPSQVKEPVRGEAIPGLVIPDNDIKGVSSIIVIPQSGKVQGLKVGVDITHTYIGDLKVELISPAGNSVVLWNRAGSGQDNLITTFDPVSKPALATLVGQEMKGNWTLKVSDLVGQDVGKLNKWNMEIT